MLLIASVILFTGCPNIFGPPQPNDGHIKIENNSNVSIVWAFYLLGEKIDDDNTDSDYWGYYKNNTIPQGYLIPPNTFVLDAFNIEKMKGHLKQGAYTYYLFNMDSVKTISWKRIVSERIWLKEVTFHSWEEMEACDFTITYP